MSTIQTLISDLELEKELLRNIKRREIDQKFIYLGDNADKYYTTKRTRVMANTSTSFWSNSLSQEQCIAFIKTLIKKDSKKTAFISLGCGNAKKECALMESLAGEHDALFYGVDTSKEMLQIAQHAFAEKELNGTFLCADFTDAEFHAEIKNIVESESIDQAIFLFIGGTLGNVPQTEIVDTLYNLLRENDTLYLDIMTRPGLEKKDDLMIFNSYSLMLENKERIQYYADALLRIGIPEENIKAVLKTESEDSIGVLRFTFAMQIQKTTIVSYRGEKVHLLPPEEIKFLEIRVYHADTFVSFYAQHGLLLIDKENSGNHEQFAFIKTEEK